MLDVLVCINDGLLKIRINRILSEKNYQFSITEKPIRRDDLFQYDVVIIHSTYNITNLIGFVENAVIQQLTTFIYVTTNTSANPFRRLNESPNIVFVDENKMDVELPLTLSLLEKTAKHVSKLKKENIELSNKIQTINIMNRCKRKLMMDGMSEESAHQHILKYAMDHHISKEEACNRLLAVNSE